MNKRRACRSIMILSIALSLTAFIPDQVLAQTDKGIELYNSGHCAEAEKVLREALKADPGDVRAEFYLGLAVLLQGNPVEALDIFQKVKKSQERASQRSRSYVPNEHQIHLALARARLGVKQYDEAWKDLEYARIENPESSDVYVYRGVFYYQQEKYGQAVKELEKAIKLDEKNPYAYYYAGLAYYKSGNGEKAINDLKMFLELAPDAPEAPNAEKIIDSLC